MAEENKPNPESTQSEKKAPAKPPAAKKAKKPKLEDKPFTEFIEQHFTPSLKEAFSKEGLEDIELTFTKQGLPIAGANPDEQCWQVIGNWQEGQRQFNLYFLDEDISGKKAFSYATSGGKPSTIESFMIDERRVTLDLLVLYTLQRLNGQKWLTRN
ncbi:MAG: DUF2996 domain-containing protein [Xenococcaceae cyanobacterium MO_188.B32]|nr:DUF2996 domain-containing protein [Xenococcaceae cyanobacterium MO_188.B32]